MGVPFIRVIRVIRWPKPNETGETSIPLWRLGRGRFRGGRFRLRFGRFGRVEFLPEILRGLRHFHVGKTLDPAVVAQEGDILALHAG